jgi:hypothetical protein
MTNTASTVKTVVQKHEARQFNGKTLHTFVASDGKRYGTGSKTPPPVGAYIQFDFTLNPKGYAQTSNWEVLPNDVNAQSAGVAAKIVKQAVNAISKDDYWTNREARDVEYHERQQVVQKTIELQSCRNTAVEFVKLLLEQQAVPVPKAKADQEEFISAMLDRYTNIFLSKNKDNKNNDSPLTEASPAEAASDEPDTAVVEAEWN